MLILGLDPGLAHSGLSLVKATSNSVEILEMRMFETSLGEDTVTDSLHRRSSEFIDFLYPYFKNNDLKFACVEELSFPRNSSAAAKIAWTWAVTATLARLNNVPILRARPQAVKEFLCDRKDASKEQVAKALRKLYKGKANFKKLLKDIPKSKQEHPYDALAMIQYFIDINPIADLVRVEGLIHQ